MGLNHKSLLFKLIIPVPVVMLACLAAAWFTIPPAMERNSIDAASDSALQTVNQIKKIRGYYTRYVVKDAVAAQSLRPGVNHQEDPGVIPLPATFVHDISALMAAERSSFSLYSPYPFPERAERPMDGFMQDAWAYLNNTPDGSYSRTETLDGETFLRVAVADRIVSEVCVSCHNSHAASPKTDWQLGDVRGIVEVRQNISGTLEASAGFTRYLLAGLGAASAVLLAAVLFAARTVTRPVASICTSMKAVAAGNLDITIAEAGRQDEIGAIGRTIVEMQGDLKNARDADQERAETQRQQQKVVDSLRTGLSRLSKGDFAFHLTEAFPEEHEELRQDFNLTSETLSSTVAQVIEAAGSIRNGAAEISQASDDLSHRTESQAATLEQTAAALDELTASVKSAAEGASSVETTMEEARLQAESNRTIVQNAVTAMAEIEQSSNHISQILGVIDDIAFQTNLLALNAGVEAARAGEAGKGFAVVASEVRALAQRSAGAAMEIKTLIGDSSRQVESGVKLVGKAGEALQSIVEQITHISQLVSGIAEGAAEQSTGLNEINTGVTQLDQVTQQNAAMVEQATAAGHMLNTDAGKLSELVAHFRVAGGSTAPAPAIPALQPAPSAHGDDNWETEISPAPCAAPETSSGNAARNLWQEF
ncbi:methyl-accepting chemotaxis protein [Leisingera sp. M658]|uniref:methyl-accepting chemotaxis protein n=1 Tax=Leisingera sp. M658 TaxID=2867015 RepID=UPI0021A66B4E|nr:methyl-accepting chemotaxis protein [Leisingera sp. M658]UWQ77100.1 methyl-accepting chemotaxis protein [Leisingera sp. M658]